MYFLVGVKRPVTEKQKYKHAQNEIDKRKVEGVMSGVQVFDSKTLVHYQLSKILAGGQKEIFECLTWHQTQICKEPCAS